MNTVHRFDICPRCGQPTQKAIAFNGDESEYWYQCTRCSTYINTYIPQAHQAAVHRDDHKHIGNFGGYGTGKTTTSREEIYKHIFLTPMANILITAQVAAQYEQTIKRELEADIPKDFVRHFNTQKQYMDLVNGARILYRPLDDPDKLRSLNLTMFLILEASETNPESFTQLKTRLRNLAAAKLKTDKNGDIIFVEATNGSSVPIIEFDWLKGIIESNPGTGWIRSQLLYVAAAVYRHGYAIADFTVPDDVKDKSISAHVASTDCNAFLPSDFIETISKNKPSWWIARYILSSFDYAEGLVYPGFKSTICATFEVPKTWRRVIAADYGLSDNFSYLLGAIDESSGLLYIYKNIVTNDKSVEQLAALFFEVTKDIPVGMFYTQPLLDPKSGAKRDYDKKTLYSHFADYGIFFKGGHIQVDARVFRVNTYIESGRLRIMDCCTDLIGELEEYMFPDRKLGVSDKAAQKPVDKNNHSINPLEWICMELPADPAHLVYGAYGRGGVDLVKQMEDEKNPVPPQLRDDNESIDYNVDIYLDF